jgi:hypothetical protein
MKLELYTKGLKGRIAKYFTVWCGVCCGQFDGAMSHNKSEVAIKAKQAGWKLTEQYGWLCPDCLRRRRERGSDEV